jgi:hypothetical protein
MKMDAKELSNPGPDVFEHFPVIKERCGRIWKRFYGKVCQIFTKKFFPYNKVL